MQKNYRSNSRAISRAFVSKGKSLTKRIRFPICNTKNEPGWGNLEKAVSMSSSSRAIPKIVPWLNADEWRATRKLLYSECLEDVKLGVLQAKIWMDRGKVPTAIESTVNFLEVILMDTDNINEFMSSRAKDGEDLNKEDGKENIFEEESSFANDRILRLAYTSAIIRFVNELVDRVQKNLFATSITKLADQINLPRVFVDIRHDGTHDRLSSLELLRWASWEALDWLEDQYWSIEDAITPASLTNDFNQNIHSLLNQFCDQLGKINDVQSAAALMKSVQTRLINQVEFLQTLPRIMKNFLKALLEFRFTAKNSENVLEAIIIVLARNSPELFYSVVVADFLLADRKECVEVWLPWIVSELGKSSSEYANSFASNLLKEFAKKSSSTLFKERLIKVWEQLGPLVSNEKVKRAYCVFEKTYLSVDGKIKSSSFKSKVSLNVLKKFRYCEKTELEGWSAVGDNWKPCPLGFTPNDK
jgi:hypothetical protein